MIIKNFFFFTATILNWFKVLENDSYKDVIIESFRYLVDEKRVKIFAFVIMPNHYHSVWRINKTIEPDEFQRDLQKFTSQTILRKLKKEDPQMHSNLYVGARDRKFQLWERNPLSVPLFSQSVVEQKIIYIHNNPVSEKWMLAEEPHKYKYSSASYYHTGIDEFGFLENYMNACDEDEW